MAALARGRVEELLVAGRSAGGRSELLSRGAIEELRGLREMVGRLSDKVDDDELFRRLDSLLSDLCAIKEATEQTLSLARQNNALLLRIERRQQSETEGRVRGRSGGGGLPAQKKVRLFALCTAQCFYCHISFFSGVCFPSSHALR